MSRRYVYLTLLDFFGLSRQCRLVWRDAREIGARPVRCGDAEMPDGRWQARCGGCGKQYDRYRRPQRQRGWFCRACGPERGKLAWREQRRGGVTVLLAALAIRHQR